MIDQPLVTVMIPTRKRVLKLMRIVNQLLQVEGRIEIIVLLDHDDEVTQMVGGTLAAKGVRVLIVPPLGYEEGVTACKYYIQMEIAAKGEFVWFASDDMEVEGDWYGELLKVPKTGFVVQPEISRLHNSAYPRYETGFFPIIPRFAWQPFSAEMPRPFDVGGPRLLYDNGWKPWFLEGVTMIHDRPDELDIIMADPARGTPEMLMRLLQEKEEARVKDEEERQKAAELKAAQDAEAERIAIQEADAKHFAESARIYAEEHRRQVEEAKRRRRFR